MLKKTYTHDGGIFARNPPEEPNEKIEQECMNALGEEARKTSMPNSL
ncbi:MAG TPA: hypothetical protein PK765_06090 [bacterium]|nr:hypothetical protein [bacterium]